MRRLVVPGLAAIALLFLGSLVLLDRLDDAEPGPAGKPDPGPASAPAPDPAPPPTRPLEPRPVPEEVKAQLASPPQDPMPVPAVGGLPPSGAPPAPAYARELLPALEARVVPRCGRVTVRLGDQLRAAHRDAGGHAVLLLDVEPLQDQARIRGSTVQSYGSTRQSLVSCAQLYLRGHVLPVSYLRPGEPVKVQVVLGPEAP